MQEHTIRIPPLPIRSIFRVLTKAGPLTLFLLLSGLLLGSCSGEKKTISPTGVDERIRYYTDQLSQHPINHPIFQLLAATYLDKARERHDPVYLARARALLNRSLEIQPNFGAYQGMTAVANYGHRFPEGLEWGLRAHKTANGTDSSTTAMLIEAHMGLGQYEEARKLLPESVENLPDYHTASAMGLWLSSQGQYDDALKAFLQAAEFARAEKSTPSLVWAEVSAAGTMIDSKRPDQARPHLEAAAKLTPEDTNMLLHRAELMALENQPEKAAEVFKHLLERSPDPEIHRLAYLNARELGDQTQAELHYNEAEKGFKDVIIAGEVYTLDALARLYCDADRNLELALALAEQNLKYKRDRQAQNTLACIRGKLKLPDTPQ